PRGRAGPLTAVLARSRSRRRSDRPELEPQSELAALAQMHEGLLEAIHDLVEAHGVMLHRLAGAPAARGEEVSLSVGPFAGTEAVHRFTQSLAAMELVREVAVLGYEGADRALLEVQISEPSA
ncbi:MAG: hypothetical protein M3Z27_00870, partial [Actinomycetota bacterium]|nr:hypothetical protein [Actinomycetota bacterium]